MIDFRKLNLFKSRVSKLCAEAVDAISVAPDFAEFLADILPEEEHQQYYCMYIADGDFHAQEFFKAQKAYAQALTRVGQEKVTTFLTPVSVAAADGKLARKNGNAYKAACVCIDIDHIADIDVGTMTDVAIASWVLNTLSASNVTLIPTWVVVSGHGLHLYWLLREIDLRNEEQLEAWEKMRKMLVAKLGGDWNALRRTQPMRSPFSLNCKDPEHIVQTRLIRLASSARHTLTEFGLPYDAAFVDAYHIKQLEAARARRAAKAGKDLAAVKTKSTSSKPANQDRVTKSAAEAYIHTASLQPTEEVHIHTATLHPDEDFRPGWRTWNCIFDLENWFIRRNGEIAGVRHMFATIYASVCREGHMPEDRAAERMATLFAPGDSCYGHTQDVVHQVYTGQLMQWREHYTAIAEVLGWTEEEKRAAYAAFSQEEKRAKAAARSKRYYMHKTEEKRGQKAEREEMVLEAMRADADKFGRLTETTLEALITTTGLSERSLRNRWREWLQYGQLVLCEYDKGI